MYYVVRLGKDYKEACQQKIESDRLTHSRNIVNEANLLRRK